jgi:hypothetical protein
MSSRDESVHVLQLAGDHALEVRRGAEDDVLSIVGPTGAGITISVTREGITVSLAGADLRLQTEGALSIHAGALALHGSRGVSITTGGDAEIRAAGDLTTSASAQRLEARSGNVDIEANDDVCVDGERVRLNSPEPSPRLPPRR